MQFEDLATKSDLQNLLHQIETLLENRIPEGFSPGRKWIRSGEVCKWLGISSSTLQNMRDGGAIPFTKLGDTYFYPNEQIQRILLENLESP